MEKAIVSLDTYEREIEKGKGKGLLGALQIGRALHQIKEGNLWATSDGCKTFEKYAESIHGFKRSTCFNLIAVWNTWGEKILETPEFQSVDTSRLVRLLPFVGEDDKQELLRDAVFIPDERGFSANLRNRRGLTAPDECETHDWQPVPYEQCTVCKQRRKVKHEEGDTPKET